jgi:hypothetical protein
VTQLCPLMPHQYVVLGRCPVVSWDVLNSMIAQSPDSYLAYFRGYQRPTRYWDNREDGHRYWRTSSRGSWGGVTHMLNRARLDSTEPPRRVDEGARPIRPWIGPWAPNGSGLYDRLDGRWWPRLDSGLDPCASCSHDPRRG